MCPCACTVGPCRDCRRKGEREEGADGGKKTVRQAVTKTVRSHRKSLNPKTDRERDGTAFPKRGSYTRICSVVVMVTSICLQFVVGKTTTISTRT